MGIEKFKTKDLKIGMYVDNVGEASLGASVKSRDFYISSANDIQKLIDNKIDEVFVDSSRKWDFKTHSYSGGEEETFEVKLTEFSVDRNVPVDIFWVSKEGESKILLREGDTFSEEVEEVCHGSRIEIVNIPLRQKKLYDEYKHAIDNEKSELKENCFQGKYLDSKKVDEYCAFKANYIPINVLTIIGDTRLPFDLYIKEDEKPSNILKKGCIVREEHLGNWVQNDLHLFIHKDCKEAFRGYILEHSGKGADEAVKAAFVREGARLLVDDLAKNPRSEKIIGESKKSVSDLTTVILDNPNSFYGLMKINSYDYYTFTHSVNVATLSIALATSYGVTKDDGLDDLGLGALLHDVGKTRISDKLINKPGKLTQGEYKTVTNHVSLGYEMLKENKSIPKRAFHPLLMHHEKLSGKGYPNKLVADEINLLGRITAIIDIYDALTTRRAYKKAFTPFDALSLLAKNEDDYDKELFAHFVQLIQRQEI